MEGGKEVGKEERRKERREKEGRGRKKKERERARGRDVRKREGGGIDTVKMCFCTQNIYSNTQNTHGESKSV